jgi:hypothetical protein
MGKKVKVYFMESGWKAKMESEKPSLISYKYTINNDHTVLLSKTGNRGKRDEKLESEIEWEPKDEKIDLKV